MGSWASTTAANDKTNAARSSSSSSSESGAELGCRQALNGQIHVGLESADASTTIPREGIVLGNGQSKRWPGRWCWTQAVAEVPAAALLEKAHVIDTADC